MRKYFILACMLAATSGCATVGMSLLGSATSVTVTQALSGRASRTFTLPEAAVREGSRSALAAMGIAPRAPEPNENPEGIYGKVGDRAIELEFESVGDSLTVMHATARRWGFVRDNATAGEIVSQTERLLEGQAAEGPVAVARKAPPTPTGSQAGAPPIYILNLETLAASGAAAPKPLPARLQDYVLYTTESEGNGRRLIHVNLGYFSSEAEANEARKIALARFPQATVAVLGSEPAPPATAAPAQAAPRGQSLLRALYRQPAE